MKNISKTMNEYKILKEHLIREKRVIRLLYFFIGFMVGSIVSYLLIEKYV